MQKRKSSLKLLAQCRKHNGPLSVDNLSLLDTLTEKEVLEEVKYLKATVAHELKMKKRITNPATGKYKMKQLPLDHLKGCIRNVLKPSNDLPASIESLLINVLDKC